MQLGAEDVAGAADLPISGWFPGEQTEFVTQTRGQYLSVTPETYANGLEEILQQRHGRYELGFKPEVLDGKRHTLGVQLSDGATNQHKGLRLRYRFAYVPDQAGTR